MNTTARMNISVPFEFYNDLTSKLPVRQRSSFIVKAVKEKLKKIPKVKKLTYAEKMRKFAGVISAKDHPEWKDIDSIVAWVNEGRTQSNRDYSYTPRKK